MTFVDETSEIASNYDDDSPEMISPQFEDRNTDPSISSDTASQVETRSMVRSIGTAPLSLSSSGSRTKSSGSAVNFSQSLEIQTRTQSLSSYPHTLSIDELIDQRATRSSHQHGHQAYSQDHSASNLTIPAIYSDTPIWPLTDPSEALLLRHFVQNLATWVRCETPPLGIVKRLLMT